MMRLFSNRTIDFQFVDERGRLSQLVHDGFKQVNVLESKKGVQRGAHYHKQIFEAFYIVYGSVEVTFKNKMNEQQIVIFKKGDFFEIPPLVLHNMFFLEDCLMVQMYDNPVENSNGEKDIFTEDDFYL